MIVRPRVPADLPACAHVLREVHDADRYPDLWPDDAPAWLTPEGAVGAWVAEVNGELVGHVVLVSGRAELWVSRLFVRPGRRGSKVGEALLDAVRHHAADTTLKLGVIEQSAAAIGLYERTGWIKVGQRDAGWVMADGTRPIEWVYRAGS